MSRKFLAGALFFSLIGVSLPLLSQSEDCAKREFIVQVVDRKGDMLLDLVESDFIATYDIEVAVPADWNKPQKWMLKINDDTKSQRRIARVKFPAKIIPCEVLPGPREQ